MTVTAPRAGSGHHRVVDERRCWRSRATRPPARAVEWQQGRRPAGPLFSSSDECQACHNNLTTTSGEDVSIGASWRGSMMANAARDPYFLASLRRETLDHASHAGDIQEECARCHVAAAQRTTSAAGGKVDVLAHAEAWQAGRLDDVDTPGRRWRDVHGLPSDRS